MRIAIFTNNYLPNPYGVATSVETFRREFEKMGHQVYIFAPTWKGQMVSDSHVFYYPSLDVKIKIRFPLGFPYSRKMDKILKDLELDIIHAQHPNLLGNAAVRWAKKKKIPLVFTWHALYDQYVGFAPFIPKKLAANFVIRQAVKFANRADAVVVPTDSIIPLLRAWGVTNEKMFPVATGVETDEFENFDKETVRKKYAIGKDETVLFLVARLTIEKNVEFIFRALKNILKEKKVRLLVAGDGYLAPKLRKFCVDSGIADNVFFCGVVGRSEIKNYYAAADIFVYASQSETQGMVMSEAMYMGLPIVAVAATGASSLVLNNGNGFLVEENEKEFADAVLKLVSNKDLRQKFRETSAKIARLQFTAEVCAEKMLEVYEECLNH